MKESFVFYHSFLEAIEELSAEDQLKIYQSVAHFALRGEEPDDLKGVTKAIFALIKPQICANNKRYEDGKKGGRPRKEKTSGFEKEKTSGYFEEKPNVNVNVNVNENDNVNVNDNVSLKEKEKEKDFLKNDQTENDPFMSNKVHEFMDYFSKEFNKGKNAISREERIRLTNVLNDLEQQGYSIEEISETICRNLKKTKFRGIDGTFNPGINWLLKDNARNFYVTMNGQFVPSYDSYSDDEYEVDEYGN